MNTANCEHENMVDDEPIFSSGSNWVGQGYRCVDCGFQTLTTSTYTPVDKPCPNCGVTFEGMDDVPEELCLACVKVNLDALIRRVQECPHDDVHDGLCRSCGTGGSRDNPIASR